jgi:hypothetical protein
MNVSNNPTHYLFQNGKYVIRFNLTNYYHLIFYILWSHNYSSVGKTNEMEWYLRKRNEKTDIRNQPKYNCHRYSRFSQLRINDLHDLSLKIILNAFFTV